MEKIRAYKAMLSYKGRRARYIGNSYIDGRIFQMAKFICTDENDKPTSVSMRPWKMKKGRIVEKLVVVHTTKAVLNSRAVFFFSRIIHRSL